MRSETDFIGTLQIPRTALYGIHSERARGNFPDRTLFNIEWYKAVATVKKACYLAALDFFREVEQNFSDKELPLKPVDSAILEALTAASDEAAAGRWFEHFIVPAVQGGAGTSINMNLNEILANRALQQCGKQPGDYETIDPLEHANIFQSTNDVIPTSLKIAAMRLLSELEATITRLRLELEKLETANRNVLRTGYTQMQAAVPSSYGHLFSSYGDALARDWWRVSKCLERIKVVNLGGSAIGTGITVPRHFMLNVVGRLREITGLPVARSENLADTTSNLDVFVEIHATMKAHAVNLEKMAGDLRLLSSDLVQPTELRLPRRQVGSSIMPGKINPVICEYAISVAHKVYANDLLVGTLCGQGCLELNAYLPVIGHALLESIQLLTGCDQTLRENLLAGIEILENAATQRLFTASAIATALLPYIGYHKAAVMARVMQEKKCDIFVANRTLQYLSESKLKTILEPQQLLASGFSVRDIILDP